METSFEKLRLCAETITNMEKLGFSITSEIEKQRIAIEEEVIKNELLPMLADQIEPVVGWFSKNFVIVVDYDAETGLEVKLSQKKKIVDVPGSIQRTGTDDSAFQGYSQQRAGGYSTTKSPTPDAYNYASQVDELKNLTTGSPFLNWKEICEYLKIEVGGDSARRRLKKWVEENRSNWPKVPEVLKR